MLVLLAVGTLTVAIWRGSATLLIVHIGIDGVIAWYLAMLVQIRQRREASFVVNLREEDVPEEAPVRVLAHG